MVKRTSVRLLALVLSFATCGSLLAEERYVTRNTRPENARWGRQMGSMGHQVREQMGNSSYYRLVAGTGVYIDYILNGQRGRAVEAYIYGRNCTAFAGYSRCAIAGFTVYNIQFTPRVQNVMNFRLPGRELFRADMNVPVYGIPVTIRVGAGINATLSGTVTPQDRNVSLSGRLSCDSRVFVRLLVGINGMGFGVQGTLILFQSSLLLSFGARDQELFGTLQFTTAGGRLQIDLGFFMPELPGIPSFVGIRLVDKTLVAAWWNLL